MDIGLLGYYSLGYIITLLYTYMAPQSWKSWEDSEKKEKEKGLDLLTHRSLFSLLWPIIWLLGVCRVIYLLSVWTGIEEAIFEPIERMMVNFERMIVNWLRRSKCDK